MKNGIMLGYGACVRLVSWYFLYGDEWACRRGGILHFTLLHWCGNKKTEFGNLL
jgi:hypothetical protein